MTSEYLDLFPGWSLHEVEAGTDISATDLRQIYFGTTRLAAALTVLGDYVDPAIREYLADWSALPAYRQCAAEHRAVAACREQYTAPWYLAADAVVTASDHVLLVKRGGTIGHGLWALPGGFLEPGERFRAAALRELREETGFALLPDTLETAFRGQMVFDHPGRSARSRIVTTAFHFDLGTPHLPEVHGRDDALEARWLPIAELGALEDRLFEDHAVILDHFLGILPDA